MNCSSARRQIVDRPKVDAEVDHHLSACASCREFAARRAAVGAALRLDHTPIVPDGAFAARVLARRGGPVELLGVAAWRLLPGALVLALGAIWLSATAPPSPLDVLLNPDDATVLLLVASGDRS